VVKGGVGRCLGGGEGNCIVVEGGEGRYGGVERCLGGLAVKGGVWRCREVFGRCLGGVWEVGGCPRIGKFILLT
jgi:hypothetical protein